MTDVAIALNSFFNSFGIPAYVEENIPDDATLPYITYTLAMPSWGEQASIQSRIWYKDAKLTAINAKCAEIKQSVGEGKSIRTDTGYVVLHQDVNFAQYQPYDDQGQSNVKVIYLNFILHAFTRR